MIVAVKGLGGFHLACDATSSTAVERLRRRKRREEKPFAVMVRGIEEAETLAILSAEERTLLLSRERPIVLVRRRETPGRLAPEVSPDGNPLVGLLLAYTPLHHLLLSDAGRPLVMTSANLSEEPIVCDNDEAVARLAGIADCFLVHDRQIESRCDDSVARVIAGGPVLLRRSRGWVPRPIAVQTPFPEPVLACGGHLKNTFCIGLGSAAYLGPHIGDLENLETLAVFEEAVARMERFLRVDPQIIAHDLHPQYVSSVYARQSRTGRKIAVQHHHAHVASAMAEHGLDGPVIGVAFDGTGYGTDGTAWGGEILLCRFEEYERLATFRPIALAGGDTAIREPWRIALALLEDAFPEGPPLDRFPLFAGVDERALDVARQMLRSASRSPWRAASGVTSTGSAPSSSPAPSRATKARSPSHGTSAADAAETASYPFAVDPAPSTPELDLRPTLRAAVADFLSGASAGGDLGPLPQHRGEGDRRARPPRGRAVRPPAGRAHGRLLPERATGGAGPRRAPGSARLPSPARASRRRRARARPGGGRGGARQIGRSLMCLGVPGRVVSVREGFALVDFFGVRREVSLDIVDEPVAPGDYILNHVGFAIRRIPQEDIGETLALYETLLAQAPEDDLMAADVRGEIAGTRDGDG